MAGQQQQFEEPQDFPDPDAVEDDELEIEILDDTPEADQRVPRPAADRIDPDSDAFENEVKEYSENAQKRIKAVKFEFHEERRAKETAVRQADEANRYAETVARDNQALKQSLDNSNTVLAEQYGARNDAELEAARKAFKTAYDDGETDDLLVAQEKMAELHAERVGNLARRPAAAPAFETAVTAAAPQSAPTGAPPDKRAMDWIRENQWFQKPGSEDMTGYAVGLHQKLVAAGYNPAIHEEYYDQINQGMRNVFPEKFSAADLGGQEVEVVPLTPVVTPRRSSPPVGGPSRGGVPSRKVQLTTTQVALAKRLGLSNKQYAAQVMKEQQANG
tara:strand:- start:8513 stop:9508 length:996 start_codon:yes stop_codon:yes gene_type:complete